MRYEMVRSVLIFHLFLHIQAKLCLIFLFFFFENEPEILLFKKTEHPCIQLVLLVGLYPPTIQLHPQYLLHI